MKIFITSLLCSFFLVTALEGLHTEPIPVPIPGPTPSESIFPGAVQGSCAITTHAPYNAGVYDQFIFRPCPITPKPGPLEVMQTAIAK